MKKVILILCALLLAAAAFTESVYDYIPNIQGRFETPEGFVIDIGGKGISYSISNKTAEVDILGVNSSSIQIEFLVRSRGRNTSGPAAYYLIRVNNASRINVSQFSSLPTGSYWYFTADVNDDRINLRDAPGTSGTSVIGQYQKGDKASFTGKLGERAAIDGSEDYWYNIDYNGTPAWIYGKYITFPNKVFLTTKMVQTQGTPVSTATAGNPVARDIASMNISSKHVEQYDPYITTEEVFTTDSYSAIIVNDGYGEYSESVFFTEENLIWVKSHNLWQFEPASGKLVYFDRDENVGLINCYDCEQEDWLPEDIVGFNKALALNKEGTKLAYIGEPTKSNGSDVFPLMVMDLDTHKRSQYDFSNQLKMLGHNMNPCKLFWIDDSTLYVIDTYCDTKWKRVVNTLCMVSLSGSSARILNYKRFDEVEIGFPNEPYRWAFLRTNKPDEFMIMLGDGSSYSYPLSFLVTNVKSAPEYKPTEIDGLFINTFWYQGERFLAAINRDTSEVIIYDSNIIEIRRTPVTFDDYLDVVSWVGIRNGEILIAIVGRD